MSRQFDFNKFSMQDFLDLSNLACALEGGETLFGKDVAVPATAEQIREFWRLVGKTTDLSKIPFNKMGDTARAFSAAYQEAAAKLGASIVDSGD